MNPLYGIRSSGVIGAAGIPLGLIIPEVPITSKDIQLFRQSVKRRRERISRVINRDILPAVLGRPFDEKSFPRIIFTESI